MLFNSIKEINRLLSKGISNINLKVTIETFSKLQLTQISLNFKTFCCNLKIRGLGAKLYLAFVLFQFGKELCCFKIKESMHFVEQKYKL